MSTVPDGQRIGICPQEPKPPGIDTLVKVLDGINQYVSAVLVVQIGRPRVHLVLGGKRPNHHVRTVTREEKVAVHSAKVTPSFRSMVKRCVRIKPSAFPLRCDVKCENGRNELVQRLEVVVVLPTELDQRDLGLEIRDGHERALNSHIGDVVQQSADQILRLKTSM